MFNRTAVDMDVYLRRREKGTYPSSVRENLSGSGEVENRTFQGLGMSGGLESLATVPGIPGTPYLIASERDQNK